MPLDSAINKDHVGAAASKEASPDAQPKLLSKAQVYKKVPRSFPTIWKWMIEGRFPAARDVCGRPMWIESEVNSWIENLPLRQYQSLEQQTEKKTKRHEKRHAKREG
jgi:predicted DNA-binding transcriptional regulator AlpA